MKVLDTSAWIEYFKGSKKGEIISKIIENTQVYTNIISLAEIAKWFSQNNENIEFFIDQIKTNSIIMELHENILIESGKAYVNLRKIKNKISLIDVIIYTSATINSLELISTDKDFEGLPSSLII